MEKRTPSNRSFIACTKNPSRLKRLARGHADVAEVEAIDPDRDLVRVTLRGGPRDARKSWERAHQIVGPRTPVQPVLIDATGAELIPTGTLHVRFDAAPKPAAIRRFERRHRVKLLRRNRYQPAQCEFAPASRGSCFLPDVIREIEESGEVRAVWQDVLAHFRRSR